MHCIADPAGVITFTVRKPDSISGISGKLTDKGGNITFDETALYFELMAEEQFSPISAPWIFLKALRSGYLTSACLENNMTRLSIDDSYEENALRLDIWLDFQNLPKHAEILHDSRRILSLDVVNFTIM